MGIFFASEQPTQGISGTRGKAYRS